MSRLVYVSIYTTVFLPHKEHVPGAYWDETEFRERNRTRRERKENNGRCILRRVIPHHFRMTLRIGGRKGTLALIFSGQCEHHVIGNITGSNLLRCNPCICVPQRNACCSRARSGCRLGRLFWGLPRGGTSLLRCRCLRGRSGLGC